MPRVRAPRDPLLRVRRPSWRLWKSSLGCDGGSGVPQRTALGVVPIGVVLRDTRQSPQTPRLLLGLVIRGSRVARYASVRYDLISTRTAFAPRKPCTR